MLLTIYNYSNLLLPLDFWTTLTSSFQLTPPPFFIQTHLSSLEFPTFLFPINLIPLLANSCKILAILCESAKPECCRPIKGGRCKLARTEVIWSVGGGINWWFGIRVPSGVGRMSESEDVEEGIEAGRVPVKESRESSDIFLAGDGGRRGLRFANVEKNSEVVKRISIMGPTNHGGLGVWLIWPALAMKSRKSVVEKLKEIDANKV